MFLLTPSTPVSLKHGFQIFYFPRVCSGHTIRTELNDPRRNKRKYMQRNIVASWILTSVGSFLPGTLNHSITDALYNVMIFLCLCFRLFLREAWSTVSLVRPEHTGRE